MLTVVGTHHKDPGLVDRIDDLLDPSDRVLVEGLPPDEAAVADQALRSEILGRVDDPDRRARLADAWDAGQARTMLVEPGAVRDAVGEDQVTYLDGGRVDGYVTHCLGQVEREERLQAALRTAIGDGGFGRDAAYATVVDGLNAHPGTFYGLVDGDVDGAPSGFMAGHLAGLPDGHVLRGAEDAVRDAVDRYFPDWDALRGEMVDRELRIGHEQARERYWTGVVHDVVADRPDREHTAIVGGVHAFDSPDSFYGKVDAVYDTARRSVAER